MALSRGGAEGRTAGQRGASRSSRVSSRSYEQRTNNDANSVRAAYEQRANSYEQRVRTRTNNEPGINYKLISTWWCSTAWVSYATSYKNWNLGARPGGRSLGLVGLLYITIYFVQSMMRSCPWCSCSCHFSCGVCGGCDIDLDKPQRCQRQISTSVY